MKEPSVGMKGEASCLVTEQHTAKSAGSGSLLVYATPWMLVLMERAAVQCVSPLLEAGETTVGVRADVRHLAATPVGAAVTAEAELTKIDGRKLTFRVAARDDAGRIGEGVHERFLVDAKTFTEKAQKRI